MTYNTRYTRPQLDRVRQGEVLSKVPNFFADRVTGQPQLITSEFATIVTPDCDIERHWEHKSTGRALPDAKLHFLMGWPATDRGVFPAGVWGKIKKCDQSSAQAIEACPADCDLAGSGLPPLIFDFKTMFSMPADLIYKYIDESTTIRRTQLMSPFRDHFVQRFNAYFGRVALEENHQFPDI